MSEASVSYRQRSVFVDIVSWVFIILTGFGMIAGILQNIMLHSIFPMFEQHANFPPDTPPLTTFMFDYMPWFFALMLVLNVFLFITSINLYRRKNWARLVFIVMLLLGVLWNIGGLAFQFHFMTEIEQQAMSTGHNEQFAEVFNGMMSIMRWFTLLFTIGLSLLFGWIAWKLHTPKIRQEFLPAPESE